MVPFDQHHGALAPSLGDVVVSLRPDSSNPVPSVLQLCAWIAAPPACASLDAPARSSPGLVEVQPIVGFGFSVFGGSRYWERSNELCGAPLGRYRLSEQGQGPGGGVDRNPAGFSTAGHEFAEQGIEAVKGPPSSVRRDAFLCRARVVGLAGATGSRVLRSSGRISSSNRRIPTNPGSGW